MPNQSSGNVVATIKRETTFGVAAAAGAGGFTLPLVDSAGFKLDRGQIRSARRNADQVRRLGRLGAKTTGGTYSMEMVPGGGMDLLLESLARSSWAVPITGSVSITTTANTIVRAAGSWIADGYRSGDIVTLSGDSVTANNGIRLRASTVTATVITVGGTPLTLNASARSVTVGRMKKVMTPVTPVYHSYSVEQRDVDIDEAELFVGTRLVGMDFGMRPNEPVSVEARFTGVDRTLLSIAQTPYFTPTTDPTGISLIADDSWIRYKGEDITILTGADLRFNIESATQPTIGAIVSPDVFMNELSVEGSVTSIRQNLLALADFDAETLFDLHFLLVAPGLDPKPAFSLYFPAVKIAGIDAPFLGGDAAKLETRELMFGPHAGDTDTDATAFVFESSET